jgi:uncharacterized cupredoxin-like copper-binding protein
VARSTRIAATLAASAATAVVAAGCGEPSFVHVRGGVLHLTLTEFRIKPQNVVVHAGQLVIVAHNAGHLTHNVVVQAESDSQGVSSTAPTTFGGTSTAQPGQTVTSSPFALKPGTYRLTCTISNHDNLGQYGTLKVVP